MNLIFLLRRGCTDFFPASLVDGTGPHTRWGGAKPINDTSDNDDDDEEDNDNF